MVNNRKHKINPLYKKREKIPRPRLKFDGNTLQFRHYFDLPTAAGNFTCAVVHLDCSDYNATTTSARYDTACIPDITKFYQTFKYTRASATWLPKVSPGLGEAAGKVHVCYIDNPEVIVNHLDGGNNSTALAVALEMRNVKSYNVWQKFTYNAPLTSRRKLFEVNTNTNYASVETVERSTQGAILFICETVTASAASVGTVVSDCDIMLKGFSASSAGFT